MTAYDEITSGDNAVKAAIMQPYFLPYIGYFQLINSVDVFVVYDNIKYTKKGWINRNRMLASGTDRVFSIPLKKDSDSLDIHERQLAIDFNRTKLLNQFKDAYRKAPEHEAVLNFLQDVLMFEDANLFGFLHASILKVCQYLGITTKIVASSALDIDHSLKSQSKVIALCQAVGATTYINPIGGVELYSPDTFSSSGIKLNFLRSKSWEYGQLDNPFVPWLSIIDVMMFNSIENVRKQLSSGYDLI